MTPDLKQFEWNATWAATATATALASLGPDRRGGLVPEPVLIVTSVAIDPDADEDHDEDLAVPRFAITCERIGIPPLSLRFAVTPGTKSALGCAARELVRRNLPPKTWGVWISAAGAFRARLDQVAGTARFGQPGPPDWLVVPGLGLHRPG